MTSELTCSVRALFCPGVGQQEACYTWWERVPEAWEPLWRLHERTRTRYLREGALARRVW